MAIAARTATKGTAASGAGFTVTFPAGSSAGDVVVLFVANAGTAGPAAPAGWTRYRNANSAGTGQSITTFTAPWSAGLTGSFTNAASVAAWTCNAYSGGDSVAMTDGAGAATSSTANSASIPAGNPTTGSVAGDYEVIGYAWTSAATLTAATGTTVDATQANSTSISCALAHNNTTSLNASFTPAIGNGTLSASNTRKTGVGVLIQALNPQTAMPGVASLSISSFAPTVTGGGGIVFVKNGGTGTHDTGGTGTTVAITVPAGGHAAGNLLVVVVGWSTTLSASGISATDSVGGNTWNVAANHGQGCAILYSLLANALASGDTITVTTTSSVSVHVASSAEFSGIASSSPFDATQSARSSGTSTTPVSGSSGTLSAAYELVIGALSNRASVSGEASGADYAGLPGLQATQTSVRGIWWEYQIVSATTALTADATWVGSVAWEAEIATFKAAAGGKTATPDTLSLATSAFAPTVSAPRLATVGLASLTLATFAPTVRLAKLATPGVTALALSAFAPTVTATARQVATPGVRALTTSPRAPTVSAPRLATPGLVTLTTTRLAPSVLAPRLVVPSTASLATTRFAPGVSAPRLVTPTTKALTITSFAPAVAATANQRAIPGAASLTLTQFAPGIAAGQGLTLVPGTGALSTTGLAPTVGTTSHQRVTPGVTALVATRFAPSVTRSDHKLAVPGLRTLTLSALAPFVPQPKTVVPDTAVWTVTSFAPAAFEDTEKLVIPGLAELLLASYVPLVLGSAKTGITTDRPIRASVTSQKLTGSVSAGERIVGSVR